jgi:polysaccharide pyruvyl transferase WcaK-like protein
MTDLKTTLLNDTSSFNHHGCDLVVRQIRQYCKRYGLNLWHTVKLDDDWRAEQHRQHLAQSDVVIVNGEGTLHDDKKAAIGLAQSAAFCRERGIPCFLINSVYQGNGSEMADLVRQFNRVFVRESRSQTELRAHGIESEVVPDMTLSHPNLPQAARKGILITDSSCDVATLQLHEFYTQTPEAELATLSKPLSASQALRISIARVIGRRASKRWGLKRHRPGKSRNQLFAAAPMEPVDDLFTRISSKSLIVTGRFHMVCMALLAGTPFIALQGNTHKIEGLLADARLTDRYRSALPKEPLAWSNWHDDEASSIEAYLHGARSRIAQMFSQMRQVLQVLCCAALLFEFDFLTFPEICFSGEADPCRSE